MVRFEVPAIGIAVGIARENHGAAGLAAAVCYFVAVRGAEVIAEAPAGSLTVGAIPTIGWFNLMSPVEP